MIAALRRTADGISSRPVATSDVSSQLELPVWLQGDEMDTAPLRPQPEPQCTNKDCPIKTPHGQGYLHNQGPLPVGRAVNSIKYPRVLMADFANMVENPGTTFPMFGASNKEHVEPILKNGYLSQTNREQCLSQTCGVEVPHGQGMYFHDRRQNWRKSETFKMCNPPPKIWDANDRIERDSGTEEERSRDRELVDSFIAHHGDKVSKREPSAFWSSSDESDEK